MESGGFVLIFEIEGSELAMLSKEARSLKRCGHAALLLEEVVNASRLVQVQHLPVRLLGLDPKVRVEPGRAAVLAT